MPRPKKQIAIEELIQKQVETVEKAKEKYDTDSAKLEELYAQRDESQKEHLLNAVEKSSKSYDEIIAFLTEGMTEEEA
jgi:hypothetical protein